MIDPTGQRVDARDRLYLSDAVPSMLVVRTCVPSGESTPRNGTSEVPDGAVKENVTGIVAGHLAQVPQGAMGEMKVIRGEIGKKRGHIALRKLFFSADHVIA